MSDHPRDESGRFAERVSDRAILELFGTGDDPFLTAPEIAEHFGVIRQAITYRLERMQEKGLVDRKDAGLNAVAWWCSSDVQMFIIQTDSDEDISEEDLLALDDIVNAGTVNLVRNRHAATG